MGELERPLDRQQATPLNEWLRRRSFENMVRFYSEELHRIIKGELPREILGDQARSLHRQGVLTLKNASKRGRILVVTPEAMEILEA